jgi:5-formyltetrahydrofolate cyclo-ligase
VDPLEPKLLNELGARAKMQLRARMKALRLAYPAAALAERSARIVARVASLPAFEQARGVALFWPMLEQNEVDVRELDAAARAANKRVYYPGFARTNDGTAVGARRFLEPPADAPVAQRGEIDLVVVPALAAALSGHRLGFGLGFYDSLLPDVRPPAQAVIVAFDFQLLAELPVMPHDVACDFVVSDTRALPIG